VIHLRDIKNHSIYFISAVIYLILVSHIHFPISAFLKPLPILYLLLVTGTTQVSFTIKFWLSAALTSSILGDISLTLPTSFQMESGLSFFFTAHLCYIILFSNHTNKHVIKRNTQLKKFASSILIAVNISIFYVLYPFLGNMTAPVSIYIFIITVMTLSAIQFNFIAAFGAFLFLISDTLIAFNEFVFPKANPVFWVMSTYYLAQFLLVKSSLKLNKATIVLVEKAD